MHCGCSICDDYYVTRGLFNSYLRNDIHGFVTRRAFIKFILQDGERQRKRTGVSTAADVMFSEPLVSQWTILILECALSLSSRRGSVHVCMYVDVHNSCWQDLFRIPPGYIAIHLQCYSRTINLLVFRQLLSISPSERYTGPQGDVHGFISRDLIAGGRCRRC